ncbi:MAG: laccase domain-containing protein, partial [Thermoanaerobaculia bacterium]|nr:laccase domain-containing protein [Thermoanaerobaculia bacterium]
MNRKPGRFEIRDTPLGRVVVPVDGPDSAVAFWTTTDFDGRLDPSTVPKILETLRRLGSGADTLQTCRQVHGVRVVEVGGRSEDWSECSDCDSLWTKSRDTSLGIKVADCLPVSIIDAKRENGAVVNLHAGWRGAA